MKFKIFDGKQISVRTLQWKKMKIPEGLTIIKLYDKHNLIGSCFINCFWVYNFVINPKFRNLGYGSKLLKKVEKEIFKRYDAVKLIPQGNDPGLREFYSKNGYTGYDEEEQINHEGEKEYWTMWKVKSCENN